MSDIREWDPVAINNSQPSPNGYPEGMLPGGVNDSDRETMAAVRRKWQDADWFDWGHVVTYVSATEFSIPSDVTTIYHVDRRVRAVMPVGGTIYGRVTAVSFVTNTTVTVLWDSGSLLLETGIQVSVGIEVANTESTSLPMYWIQNQFGLLDPDILCYQNKNAVDLDGGNIASAVLLESLPNVQNQVASPNDQELDTLLGIDTSQSIQAQFDELNALVQALTPVGTILPYPSTDLSALNARGEWRVCNGTTLNTTTYAALFALVGYSYGGSGASFGIPDLRARVPVGHDVGNSTGRMTGYRQGISASSLGNTGGEQSHNPTIGEMADHDHPGFNIQPNCTVGGRRGTASRCVDERGAVNDPNKPTGDTGGGENFNVTQPGQVVNYVIRVL